MKPDVKGYVAKGLARDMKRLWKTKAPRPWESPVPPERWLEKLPTRSREAAKTLDLLVRKRRLPETEMLNLAQYGFDFERNGLLGNKAPGYLGLTCDGDGFMYALELASGKVVFYDAETDRLVPKRSFEDLDTFFWIMVRLSAVNDGLLERKKVEPEVLALGEPGTKGALAELPEDEPEEPAPGGKGDRKLARKFLDKGVGEKVMRDFEKAVALFTKAITADPAFGEAYFYRGDVRVNELDDGDGISDLRIAARRGAPKHAKVHLVLGRALEKAGDLGGAIGAYTGQIESDPRELWALFDRARCKMGLGDRKGAREDVAALRRISSDMGGTYFDNGDGAAKVKALLAGRSSL